MKMICASKFELMFVFMLMIITIFVSKGIFFFFLLSCLLGLLNIEGAT